MNELRDPVRSLTKERKIDKRRSFFYISYIFVLQIRAWEVFLSVLPLIYK